MATTQWPFKVILGLMTPVFDFVVGEHALFGSIFVFKEHAFIWRVEKPEDITIESLSLCSLHFPQPSILLPPLCILLFSPQITFSLAQAK